MERMQSWLEGVKILSNEFAPNFLILGARLREDPRRLSKGPIYVAGKGTSLSECSTRLYGEGAESAAAYIQNYDEHRPVLSTDWKEIERVPASSVLIGPHSDSPGSAGCAAHNVIELAFINSLHELVEHHAVNNWWDGKTAAVYLGNRWGGYNAMNDAVAKLRRGAEEPRFTNFYSLGRYGPVQTAMAQSQTKGGDEIAVAFAASDTLENAVHRAVEELLSVEWETSTLREILRQGANLERESSWGLVQARQKALATTHSKLFNSFGKIPNDPKSDLNSNPERMVSSLASEGLNIKIISLYRPEIGLPSIRTMFENPELNLQPPTGFELSPY